MLFGMLTKIIQMPAMLLACSPEEEVLFIDSERYTFLFCIDIYIYFFFTKFIVEIKVVEQNLYVSFG